MENELEHLKAYLYLEKLRFKDKLEIVYDLQYTDFEVPPLMLQILAENAVKHGLSKRPEGGRLTIHTEEAATHILVTVSDNGVGFDVNAPIKTDRSHIGLVNLKARIANNLHGAIDIQSVIGEGTIVTILIPKNPISHKVH